MGFDLPALLAARRDQGYELHARYLNPQLPRMLHAIGFDKVYERGEGCYLYDRDGSRYLDYLSGFGVFAVGRNHLVVRRSLTDVIDGELADMAQFDCALLSGLLAEQLLARAPGLDSGILTRWQLSSARETSGHRPDVGLRAHARQAGDHPLSPACRRRRDGRRAAGHQAGRAVQAGWAVVG